MPGQDSRGRAISQQSPGRLTGNEHYLVKGDGVDLRKGGMRIREGEQALQNLLSKVHQNQEKEAEDHNLFQARMLSASAGVWIRTTCAGDQAELRRVEDRYAIPRRI